MLRLAHPALSHEDLFLERYERLVVAAATLTAGDREAARDLVHEAYLHFVLARPPLDAVQQIDSYLFITLRNLYISRARRAARTRGESLSLLEFDSAALGLRTRPAAHHLEAIDEAWPVGTMAGTRGAASASNQVMVVTTSSDPARGPEGEADLVARIARRDPAAFETLMRRHNGRLFRVARAILKDEAAAEDALQEAYLEAFRHIGDFKGGAALGTWLTRITINQALMRLRQQKRDRVVVPFSPASRDDEDARDASEGGPDQLADRRIEPPPQAAWRAELRALLERRIDELPVAFRTVFVLREIEDLTVDETAACLAVPPATVRTRLFRARALLRNALARDIDSAAIDVFGFAGERCDRIVADVLRRAAAEDRAPQED